jgi:hypothetical protein
VIPVRLDKVRVLSPGSVTKEKEGKKCGETIRKADGVNNNKKSLILIIQQSVSFQQSQLAINRTIKVLHLDTLNTIKILDSYGTTILRHPENQ